MLPVCITKRQGAFVFIVMLRHVLFRSFFFFVFHISANGHWKALYINTVQWPRSHWLRNDKAVHTITFAKIRCVLIYG